MVDYDKIISSEQEGVCAKVAKSQQRRLENLWEKAVDEGKEVAMGFGIIGDEVHVSAPMPGDEYTISRAKIETAVTGGIKYDNKQYDRIGHIHTHPVEEETMPSIMSPNDFNTHLQMADSIGGYTTSLVLTHLGGDHVLFGISADSNPRNLGIIQDELAGLQHRFLNHDETGDDPYQILADMESLMLEHYEPCSYRF